MTTEYISMSNSNYDKISDRVRKSFSNACICWIEQIKNSDLLDKYQQCKSEMAFPNECQLFHGTNKQTADIIIQKGFDSSKNVRSRYGKGSYFAEDAMYSFDFMPPDPTQISYMFLCDVLVGTVGVDCSVNNEKNSTIFAVPRNDAIFPKYLIAFHKYAK